MVFLLQCMSSLMAQSRHPDRVGECPLSGVKRTSKFKSVTSALTQRGSRMGNFTVRKNSAQWRLASSRNIPYMKWLTLKTEEHGAASNGRSRV